MVESASARACRDDEDVRLDLLRLLKCRQLPILPAGEQDSLLTYLHATNELHMQFRHVGGEQDIRNRIAGGVDLNFT